MVASLQGLGAAWSLARRAAFLAAAAAASACEGALAAALASGAMPVVRGNSLDAFSLSWLTCFFLTGEEVALLGCELLLLLPPPPPALLLLFKALCCSVEEIKLMGASLKLSVSFLTGLLLLLAGLDEEVGC